jgi:hypothetical protein
MDQLPHHVQTAETDYKYVFLQPNHILSKHELPLPYTVAGIAIFWPLVQILSKQLSPELRMFCDIFHETHMLNTSALKTHIVCQSNHAVTSLEN